MGMDRRHFFLEKGNLASFHRGDSAPPLPVSKWRFEWFIGFVSPGEQKRYHALCGQHRRDGKPGRRDFGARVKALLESASHADQKRQKSHVEENYADRLARIGRDFHRRNCRASASDANSKSAFPSNSQPS